MNKTFGFRWVVWLLCLMVLLGALLTLWRLLQKDVERSALEVANQKVVEQANYLRQKWLVLGKPEYVEWQGEFVYMLATGWAYPHQQGLDCQALLSLLYPEQQILQRYPQIDYQQQSEREICRYDYFAQQGLELGFYQERFFATRLE